MKFSKKILALVFLLASSYLQAQLGFCTGSKGDPVFDENFGNGTNYGPALPAGTTNYPFVTGSPNDGSYTLFYRTNLYSTWHYSLDHTPDTTNGVNGKCLIVNANANTSGEFYKRIVTGLCINTTFEFSAWVMNVYNPGSGFCGANEKPINIQFEIWNDTETVLLGSGNTGNIMGSFSPVWQQFGIVFTTSSQTSVVLKMKNNGVGGCGNDLAIDDIIFRSCGDLTTIGIPSTTGNSITFCQGQSSSSITLQATTTGTSPYFYQWQSSTNGFIWNDIPGANSATYITPNLTTQTFFRTKVAQDIANLSNDFCSTISNIFTVTFSSTPNTSTSNGDATICSNQPIPQLSVTADASTGVNWYSAPSGGTLLLANSTTYTPTSAGTYYAETYNLANSCLSSTRTPVTLTIVPLPTVSISGSTSICSGNTATISFSGTPNTSVVYTVDGGANQSLLLDLNGLASITTPALTASSTYTLISGTSSVLSSCTATLSGSVTIVMNATPTVTISGDTSVCVNSPATITLSNGTANAIVTYTVNGGANQTLPLNSSGSATIAIPNVTSTLVYDLVSVTSSGVNGCTQLLNQSFTISIVPLPTANLTASPLAVCSGQTSTLNFSGTPNAIVTYTENGGANQTITLNSAGAASIATAAITTATTYQLVNVALGGTSTCTQTVSDSVTLTINPTPTANYNGPLNYCSGETTAITLTSNLVGTTFNWTVVQNGSIGATSGTGAVINQVLSTTSATDGTATYTVTPFFNGCAGTPISITVTVHALPNPTTGDGVICLNSSSTAAAYLLDTNLNATDYSFVWTFNNTVIPNAFGNTYNATQIGTYTVVVTNLLTGCVSAVDTALVSASNQGESLIVTQTEAFTDYPVITVTVVGGDGPFLYQLNDGVFQSSNVFYPIASGMQTITVVDESFCTNLTAVVTLINYPHYFTPNGDGIHDTWNIRGVNANARILIFDRYGKLLKQISPESSGWDGTYNGQPLLADDYWFTIDYLENGAEKTFSAHFSLKR